MCRIFYDCHLPQENVDLIIALDAQTQRLLFLGLESLEFRLLKLDLNTCCKSTTIDIEDTHLLL